MRSELKKVPRVFMVGLDNSIKISDYGTIQLDGDEQVTFVTRSGKHYDLAAKSWGFYATPSINGRLAKEGLRTVLVRNLQGRYYIMLVEKERTGDFEDYLKKERLNVEKWLDEL